MAVVLALAFAAQANAAGKLKKLNVIFPIDRSMIQFAIIVGEALGYYAEEGIELNYLPSQTTVPFVAFLKNRDAELAFLDGPQVFQAASANIPIAVVYEGVQRATEGVTVPADSPFKSCAELVGKTVGLVSDRDRAIVKIAMDLEGKSIDDVKTVVLGESGPTLAMAFKKKTVAAIAGSFSDWFAIKAHGIKVREITPLAYSETPSNSFVIHKPRRNEISDIIKGFLRAYSKGTYAGEIDHEVLEAMCRRAVPEEWQNVDYGRRFLWEVMPINIPITPRYGDIRPKIWEQVQDNMIKIGEIKKRIDVSAFLDNSFIHAANDFDKAEIQYEVKAWREKNM
jgi:NitT/TauT family transport system substrate-binding protein